MNGNESLGQEALMFLCAKIEREAGERAIERLAYNAGGVIFTCTAGTAPRIAAFLNGELADTGWRVAHVGNLVTCARGGRGDVRAWWEVGREPDGLIVDYDTSPQTRMGTLEGDEWMRAAARRIAPRFGVGWLELFRRCLEHKERTLATPGESQIRLMARQIQDDLDRRIKYTR